MTARKSDGSRWFARSFRGLYLAWSVDPELLHWLRCVVEVPSTIEFFCVVSFDGMSGAELLAERRAVLQAQRAMQQGPIVRVPLDPPKVRARKVFVRRESSGPASLGSLLDDVFPLAASFFRPDCGQPDCDYCRKQRGQA